MRRREFLGILGSSDAVRQLAAGAQRAALGCHKLVEGGLNVNRREQGTHPMPPGTPRGPVGFKQFYNSLRLAFPDLRYTVDDVIAEGDRVVVRWNWQCTHRGEFMGVAATGKRATVTGMAIYRVADGQCVERWVELGLLGLLHQLGAVPTPGRTAKSASTT